MMAGLAMENTEVIILDAKNNRYDGPRGLFRIVLDEFDGQIIRSWHIEDRYGERSRNLGNAKCKSLDAIVGRVGLMTPINDAIDQLNWTKPEYVNKLILENQCLKEEIKKLKK